MDTKTRQHVAKTLRAAAAVLTAAPTVGDSWDIGDTVYTITETAPHPQTGEVFVRLDAHDTARGIKTNQILPAKDVESEITFLRRQHESRQRMAEKKKAKDAVPKIDLRGFGDDLSPMRKAKVIDALKRGSVKVNGKFTNRAKAIPLLIDNGYRVFTHPKFKHVLMRVTPDESISFWTQRDLTKTGLDFARYLQEQKIGKKGLMSAEPFFRGDYGWDEDSKVKAYDWTLDGYKGPSKARIG